MPRKEKTRNSGKWTEARFWGFIRSALRKASMRWGPLQDALTLARRSYQGDNKRQKWEYRCCQCQQWQTRRNVEIHHIEPCGELKTPKDLPRFVEKLFCEAEGFEVICKDCHRIKHGRQ